MIPCSSGPGQAVRRTASLPLAYARPSTSFVPRYLQVVDARVKPGHDERRDFPDVASVKPGTIFYLPVGALWMSAMVP